MRHSTKKLLSAFLSLSILITAFSGCDADKWDTSTGEERTMPAETSTTPPKSFPTQQTTTTPAEEEEVIELLSNREKASNGLVTDITATEYKGSCVAQNTAFRMTLAGSVSEDELKKRISTYPEADFTIKRENNNSYILSTKEDLPEGTVVQIQVADENGSPCDSWAFQTTEPFKIKSTYPANGSDSVYSNAGIEIEFSAPPAQDSSSFVEINPAVGFRTQIHRNTLYIVPENELEQGTEYYVTVKEGLASEDGQTLSESLTFSFITAQVQSKDYFYTNYGLSETFLEGDPAVIEIYCSKALKNREFDISLYSFDNAESYMAELKAHRSKKKSVKYYTDVSALNKVFSDKQKPLEGRSEWRPRYFVLPDNLVNGWYIADMSVGELRCQYLIQVSPISVYSMGLGEENLFFINDTVTGNAASDARIVLTTENGTYTGKTNSDGTVNITAEAGDRGILDITYGDMRYVDEFETSYAEELTFDDLYYMYIYTDRAAYLPTDTVQVWGIVSPRRDDAPVPKDLSLVLGSETGGQAKNITLNPDGTFFCEFSFENYTETWWLDLILKTGDEVMDETSIRIEEYIKPTYTFDVTLPTYAVMPHKDRVHMEVSASYYEGTPAKDLLFKSNAQSADPSVIKTDINGYAEAELLFEDHDSWYPNYIGHSLGLTGIENEYNYEGDLILSFFRDVMLEEEYDKDTHNLTVYTNKIDFTKIEEFMAHGEKYYYYSSTDSYDILKGETYDTKVKISITHHYSERVESGTYYDFIEKETRKCYDYISHSDFIGDFTVNTVNGVGVFENLPTTSDKGYYSVTITYNDSLGQKVTDFASYGNYDYSRYYTEAQRYYYSFSFENSEGEDTRFFKENETITVKLDCNHEFEGKGRVLFASYQNDFIHYDVYNGIEFGYSPSLDCLPNFIAQGAYFDGRHIYPVSGRYMYFEPEERNISLSVTTDDETYDAGETVYMTVNAKDEKGKPVKGATVMLSVVDEAAFASADQQVDILGDIYETVWYDYASDYYSYIQHVLDEEGGAEKGGGEGSALRKDFKDNAYFGSLTTDSSGNAQFVFKLPDNLTTWRATIQSIKTYETGRISAGDIKHPIISTRPVFITPIMLSTFMTGDDIAVTAKAHGIDRDDAISVTIEGGDITKSVSILSAQTANFGKLPAGEYKVTFETENNGNKDAVQLPLTVTDTILQTDVFKSGDMEDTFDINPVSWPVHVSFVNKEYIFVTEVLRRFAYTGGNNLATRVGRAFARSELGYITEEDFKDMFLGETMNGFAKPLPAAAEDITLTALLCASTPEIINKSTVVPMFEAVISDKESYKSEVCKAYLGLAALGSPVLNEVRSLIKSGQITDYYQNMYLISALAIMGDYDTAYEYYSALVPEVGVYTDNGRTAAFVNCKDKSQRAEYTKAALMAASLMKLPEADYLATSLYSYEYIELFESYAPEMIIYIKNFVPKSGGEAVFSYNLNGETQTVTLDYHRRYHLSFGEEQWKNADFKLISGEIHTNVSYVGRKTELEGGNLNITKTLSGDFYPGGLVKVTIKTQPYCSIDDVIPSCGRYVENGSFGSRSGQKVSLYTDKFGSTYYYFRIVTEGEYVVESAVSQSYTGLWGESGRQTITVNSDEAV